MQGATTRSFILVLLVLAAAFVAPAPTALAKPEPVTYVLVSHTKGCLVTLNLKTGRLTFLAEKGHYGKFTVVVRHGKSKKTYHFTVKKPKPGQKLPTKPVVAPPSQPTGAPIIIVPIVIPGPTGPAGPPGDPGTPTPVSTPPTTTNPPAPPKPPPSTPNNLAPVLRVNGGVISWAADKGADTFHGAISTAPRNAASRTTTYTVLGIVTSWKPAPPPCGTTLYYGVASEGNAGEQWTANEVSITGPKCVVQNVAPVLTYKIGPAGNHEPALIWPDDPAATSYKAASCTSARNTPGRTCTYITGIATAGDPFGFGQPLGLEYWDLLGSAPGGPVAPCGDHWFSIASEGPAGELWAAAEYDFGGNFGLGLPKCPPPQVGGPPTPPPVHSTLPVEQCISAIDRINTEDGAPANADEGELSQLNADLECQTMNDLAPANSQTLTPVSTINQDHLCEDWATAVGEFTNYISGWYVSPTGNCDVVTTTGEYVEAFNASVSWASVDIVSEYAHAAVDDFPLPWTM
jgi:hypothetical protein